MVAATLFMVASSYIIRKQDLFFGVDVAAETAFLVAGGASVPCRHALIRLENESVCAHRLSRISVAFSALSAFWRGEDAESAENAGLRSKFGINAMSDFLKVNPGKPPDKILECALRHGVG